MPLLLSHLTTTYANGVRALADVSLRIEPGVFGLLGPNGAGKSTLMRTIATLQQPDSGEIRFGDIDVRTEPARLRAILGYLPQEFGLYPTMSALDILDHFANLKGLVNNAERRDRVEALLEQVNLWDVRTHRAGTFSGGMKQRLGIAIALAGQPQLLIVDEPTAGLDPAERNRLLDLLASVGDDVLVILSTHIVEDVRDLCRDMAIIDRGRVVAHGAPTVLLEEVRGRIWRKTVPRDQGDSYRARHTVISTRLSLGATALHVLANENPGDGFAPVDPDLEDLYFARLARTPTSSLPST